MSDPFDQIIARGLEQKQAMDGNVDRLAEELHAVVNQMVKEMKSTLDEQLLEFQEGIKRTRKKTEASNEDLPKIEDLMKLQRALAMATKGQERIEEKKN